MRSFLLRSIEDVIILCQWDWKIWKNKNIKRVHLLFFSSKLLGSIVEFPDFTNFLIYLFNTWLFSNFPNFSKPVDNKLTWQLRQTISTFFSKYYPNFPKLSFNSFFKYHHRFPPKFPQNISKEISTLNPYYMAVSLKKKQFHFLRVFDKCSRLKCLT